MHALELQTPPPTPPPLGAKARLTLTLPTGVIVYHTESVDWSRGDVPIEALFGPLLHWGAQQLRPWLEETEVKV